MVCVCGGWEEIEREWSQICLYGQNLRLVMSTKKSITASLIYLAYLDEYSGLAQIERETILVLIVNINRKTHSSFMHLHWSEHSPKSSHLRANAWIELLLLYKTGIKYCECSRWECFNRLRSFIIRITHSFQVHHFDTPTQHTLTSHENFQK